MFTKKYTIVFLLQNFTFNATCFLPFQMYKYACLQLIETQVLIMYFPVIPHESFIYILFVMHFSHTQSVLQHVTECKITNTWYIITIIITF